MAWTGQSGMPPFEQQMGYGQNGEDWEDWLRWDPTADATSPEDGTFGSGSSKNDSPLQDPALPFVDTAFGGETLALPLIAGEDMLEFAGVSLGNDQTVLGGADGYTSFDFDMAPLPAQQPSISKLDTTWQLPSNAELPNVDLSALSNPSVQQFSQPGPAPSDTPSLHFSPTSSQNRASMSGNSISNSPPQPAPKKKGGRKRKAEIMEEEQIEDMGDWQEGDEPPVKKTSHNVIEKRYRNNLNDKIVELRSAVPALRAMGRAHKGENTEDLEGLTPAHKLNKATVMHKATEYIRHLEKRNKTISDEMDLLKERLAAVEAAIGKNRDRQSSLSHSPPTPNATMRPRQTSAASQSGGQAYLGVSPEQTRYGQQYIQPQGQPAYARPSGPPAEAQNQPQYRYGRNGGGGTMGKVMMGAMAGLMVMEGFSEQDGDTRQMFAAPTALFRRGLDLHSTSPTVLARQMTLPLVKIFCIIGALLYIIAPLINFSPRRKAKTRPTVRLPQMPSLASPVEVRRKAWLTALQTVYVPKHFLLEVAAVTAKMISLSLRRTIGTETWNAMTGTNKEEEAARMKAWDIAIDAQLAGGDAEVSYHRLLLTLMASGTLPDSPARLMQKAVHFRVFFWEVANAGYGNILGFKQFTEKVGKIYWNSARKLQKELLHAKSQGRPAPEDDVELLPDHLADLVELECDDVLNDEMIQRAWNLAWNKPSAYNTSRDMARDGVIEDHAIRSPLDAVAAWYANMTVDDTLLDAVAEHPSSINTEYYLALAVSVAPPVSATLARALAAKAVLSNSHRDANIVLALEALPSKAGVGERGVTMNLVQHVPATPDVHVALTIAKLLSLLAPGTTFVAQRKAYEALPELYITAESFTLLTAIAAYRLLKTTNMDRGTPLPAQQGLEDVAANLRLWVGTLAGREVGLGAEEMGRVVQVCLGVVGKVGGWEGERDSGYGGSSAGGSPVREVGNMGLVV
ncbi:Clr6 histone deacetylase associated PHD protein-2 Cph2 [Recurvomyces mirabilis]|uniref:Clr6 histone deacetylase associated PHD protein-2 Cph2 n=1 Tax=Recurvomyces mirabilis TaxID=574656 RepID=A0AAE0WJ50_9PEZI|nr:Clr6 histone deacetylase associated PHD protein-2 Cph2 [Recurvomyces mirabilis]KAK5151558.1 Clr6 histone deacetylase associated PHD protein-2 Cph2 [Recurvomyces mirabilis]